jgi:hypothetical protein
MALLLVVSLVALPAVALAQNFVPLAAMAGDNAAALMVTAPAEPVVPVPAAAPRQAAAATAPQTVNQPPAHIRQVASLVPAEPAGN